MLDWKIYFVDGTVFSDKEGPVQYSPIKGVAVIAKVHQEGRGDPHGVLWLCDYYLFHAQDGWFGVDIFGLIYHLTHDRDNQILAVRQGQTMSNNAEFQKILDRAIEDENFGPYQPHKTDRPHTWNGTD